MGLFVWLHYAFRAILLLFGRLQAFRFVKVHSAVVCWHIIELRVIFTSSRHPSDRHPRTLVISVRTPSALIAAMKPLTVARCAIVNELLRRKEQTIAENFTHPRPLHTKLLTVAFEEVVADAIQTESKETDCSLVTSAVKQVFGAETADLRSNTLERLSTAIMHRRRSGVWKPTLSHDRSKSAVLKALQFNTHWSTTAAPATSKSMDTSENNAQQTQKNSIAITMLQPVPCEDLRRKLKLAAFHFPLAQSTHDDIRCESALMDSNQHLDDSTDSASPTSESTLFEEPALERLISQFKRNEGAHIYSRDDGTEENARLEAPKTPATRRPAQHQRQASIDSAFDATETPSVSVWSRSKTDDGLLPFKANAARDSMAPSPKPARHRRKISLNLPINTPVDLSEGFRQPEFSERAGSPRRKLAPISISNSLKPEERELEYKHRHTFIGAGSLDDFLELLEISSTYTTTKAAVARAFIHLSSTEQRYARQCSTSPEGWHLVSRTTLDVMDITSVDYLLQLQVKLGSITLRQFLDMIHFDDENEATAVHIIEAFSAASHIDSQSGVGVGSKARAFRSWLVTQKAGTC